MTAQLDLFERVDHHGGNPATSVRLKNTLAVLSDMKPHSTLDIQEKTGSMAVSTDIGDLRKSGYEIECHFSRVTFNGRKVYVYMMRAA